MRLLCRSGSSASYRVRIALHLKGLADRIAVEHLSQADFKSDAYRRINPEARVPALDTGSGLITQSMAILEYFEDAFPDPSILPDDPLDRARSRSLAQIVVSDIHPLQNTGALAVLERDFGLAEDAQRDWARHWIRRGLLACEAALSGGRTPYACGDVPTMADICIVPQMRNADRFGVPTDDLLRLTAIRETCLAHPAFAAAHPDANPDPSD